MLSQNWELAFVISWSIKIIDQYTTFIEEYISCVSHLISVGRLFNYMNHEQLEWNDKKNVKVEFDYDEFIRNPKK